MTLKRMIIVILIWIFLHLCIMLYFGLIDDIRESDAAVVYGNQVYTDGSLSLRLQTRLDRAVELYHQKYFKYIVVSGAIDRNRNDEARFMAEYLASKGVPDGAIIQDNAGNNTQLTAVNLRKIMKDYDIKTILVISQYYHILRIKLSLYKEGISDVRHAHALMSPESRDFHYVPREIAAFYYYVIR